MPVALKMEWAPAAFLGFAESAEARLRDEGEAALESLVDELRAVFTERDALAELFNSYLQKVAEDPLFHGDGAVGSNLFTIWYSEHLALRLVKNRSDVTSFSPAVDANVITNFPGDTLLLYLGRVPGRLTWYQRVEGASFDRFDATLMIERTGQEAFEFGHVIHVDSHDRFPQFDEDEDSLWLVLTGRPTCSQIVSFDAETLRPRGASMSSEISSVICAMLDVVRLRGDRAPAQALAQLAGHHDHHVRWSAVRALWRHERTLAVELMEAMAANDPHPFVQSAARASIIKLEAAHAQN